MKEIGSMADEAKITCCFTGPRPKNYPWGGDKVREARVFERLEGEIGAAVDRGYRRFISGMAVGMDMLAAKIVLRLRERMPEKGITLEAALPFLSQPRRWREETKREYGEILARCDGVHVLSDAFSLTAYGVRDRYMVDRSSLVIAVRGMPSGGTARTIAYAKESGKEVVLIESE